MTIYPMLLVLYVLLASFFPAKHHKYQDRVPQAAQSHKVQDRHPAFNVTVREKNR